MVIIRGITSGSLCQGNLFPIIAMCLQSWDLFQYLFTSIAMYVHSSKACNQMVPIYNQLGASCN